MIDRNRGDPILHRRNGAEGYEATGEGRTRVQMLQRFGRELVRGVDLLDDLVLAGLGEHRRDLPLPERVVEDVVDGLRGYSQPRRGGAISIRKVALTAKACASDVTSRSSGRDASFARRIYVPRCFRFRETTPARRATDVLTNSNSEFLQSISDLVV